MGVALVKRARGFARRFLGRCCDGLPPRVRGGASSRWRGPAGAPGACGAGEDERAGRRRAAAHAGDRGGACYSGGPRGGSVEGSHRHPFGGRPKPVSLPPIARPERHRCPAVRTRSPRDRHITAGRRVLIDAQRAGPYDGHGGLHHLGGPLPRASNSGGEGSSAIGELSIVSPLPAQGRDLSPSPKNPANPPATAVR